MKRPLLKLLAVLLLALIAGVGAYRWRTAPMRTMLCCEQPELAWLQYEFNLSETDAVTVARLHSDYLSRCAEICARIDATNSLIRQQIVAGGRMTPAVEQSIQNAARLRVECQTNMLAYFFEVSHAMAPEQGQRYLAWVQERIFSMSHEAVADAEASSHHGH